MLKEKQIPCVFARLGLECPETSASDVKNPPGKPPAMRDVVTLHLPLPVGSQVREEVETRICPGLADQETFLDTSEEEKPGSIELKVTRKSWGEYLLKLQGEKGGPVVLRMEGAALRGKPRISLYKEVDPVLVISMRGQLTNGSGETSDQIRRQWVHSQLLLTLEPQQAALNEDGQADLDAGVQDAQQAQAPAAAPAGSVEGDRAIGPRKDALPEHTYTCETAKAVAERLEKVVPGFMWDAIRIRQRSKPTDAVKLGWTELTQAAAARGCIANLKEIRTEVEAAQPAGPAN